MTLFHFNNDAGTVTRLFFLVLASGTLAACTALPSQLGQIQRLPPQPVAASVIVQTDANQVQRDADVSAQILRDQTLADQQAAAARAAEVERQRIANEWVWYGYPAPYTYAPYGLAPAWGWGGHLNYGFGGRGHWRGGVSLGF